MMENFLIIDCMANKCSQSHEGGALLLKNDSSFLLVILMGHHVFVTSGTATLFLRHRLRPVYVYLNLSDDWRNFTLVICGSR